MSPDAFRPAIWAEITEEICLFAILDAQNLWGKGLKKRVKFLTDNACSVVRWMVGIAIHEGIPSHVATDVVI